MFLRVTMQLTDAAIGSFKYRDFKPEEEYTGNHIAVFECKLKTPPALTLIDHSHREYVLAHRLNFNNFKLVDIDNYMQGNPYFTKKMTAEEWNKSISTIVGDVKQEKIDSQNIVNKWKRNLAFYEELMSQKEPLSNIRMPLINKEAREKEAAAKKEAEAAAKAAKKEADAAAKAAAGGSKKGKKNKEEAVGGKE